MSANTWNSTAFEEDELVTASLGQGSYATGKVIDFKHDGLAEPILRLQDVVHGETADLGYDGLPGSFFANRTAQDILTAPSGVQAQILESTSAAHDNVSGGDLLKYSGDVIYVENRSPITRADDQIEDLKIIIEF